MSQSSNTTRTRQQLNLDNLVYLIMSRLRDTDQRNRVHIMRLVQGLQNIDIASAQPNALEVLATSVASAITAYRPPRYVVPTGQPHPEVLSDSFGSANSFAAPSHSSPRPVVFNSVPTMQGHNAALYQSDPYPGYHMPTPIPPHLNTDRYGRRVPSRPTSAASMTTREFSHLRALTPSEVPSRPPSIVHYNLPPGSQAIPPVESFHGDFVPGIQSPHQPPQSIYQPFPTTAHNRPFMLPGTSTREHSNEIGFNVPAQPHQVQAVPPQGYPWQATSAHGLMLPPSGPQNYPVDPSLRRRPARQNLSQRQTLEESSDSQHEDEQSSYHDSEEEEGSSKAPEPAWKARQDQKVRDRDYDPRYKGDHMKHTSWGFGDSETILKDLGFWIKEGEEHENKDMSVKQFKKHHNIDERTQAKDTHSMISHAVTSALDAAYSEDVRREFRRIQSKIYPRGLFYNRGADRRAYLREVVAWDTARKQGQNNERPSDRIIRESNRRRERDEKPLPKSKRQKRVQADTVEDEEDVPAPPAKRRAVAGAVAAREGRSGLEEVVEGAVSREEFEEDNIVHELNRLEDEENE